MNDPVIGHSHAAVRGRATKQEIYAATLQCIKYLGAGAPHIALTALKDFLAEDGRLSSETEVVARCKVQVGKV